MPTAIEYAKLLKPFVTRLRWITYGEEMIESPLQSDMLISKKAMLQTLAQRCSHMSFPQVEMAEGFAIILEERQTEWELPITDTEEEDWPVRCAKRVRTMCKHVTQRMLMPRPPAWLAMLDLPAKVKQETAAAAPTEPVV